MPQAEVALPPEAAAARASQLQQRARLMFSGGAPGSGPQRSGQQRVATEASDGLLVDAMAAINDVGDEGFMIEPRCRTIRGLIKEHPVLVVEAPAPAILKLNALEDDSAPILRSEILPIEKGSIIADLHELEDGLDDFRRLRVVGRNIGRHVELQLEREPFCGWCHRNTVAWVARNRG